MKQTTIFDFFPYERTQQNNCPKINIESNFSNNKIQNIINNKNCLEKSYIQKNLSQIIEEQIEFKNILISLGNSWYIHEKGFGFTTKDNIMMFSTIQDFNNNFFNSYNINDFEKIEDSNVLDLCQDRLIYYKINNIEYNSYYLSKALEIIGDKCKIFQHKKLKLLFIRNNKYAALICPKL